MCWNQFRKIYIFLIKYKTFVVRQYILLHVNTWLLTYYVLYYAHPTYVQHFFQLCTYVRKSNYFYDEINCIENIACSQGLLNNFWIGEITNSIFKTSHHYKYREDRFLSKVFIIGKGYLIPQFRCHCEKNVRHLFIIEGEFRMFKCSNNCMF